jgi:hypothetical protein
MKRDVTCVGLDVHEETIVAAGAEGRGSEVHSKT